MFHTTTIVDAIQLSDGEFAICISCCGLEGQILDCSRGEDAVQCPNCAPTRTAVTCAHCGHKTHPGCPACHGLGHTHEKDTRSWHTMASTVVNDAEKRAGSIQWAHQRVAANHEAALQAEQQLKQMIGSKVEHAGA